MNFRLAIAITSFLALAGCEAGAPVQSTPVTPTYKASSSQLKANAINPVEVRAFQKSAEAGSAKQEISGIPCTVSSAFYEAKVATPGIVLLPSYAEQTPAVTVSCVHKGQTITRIVNPYNKTVNQRTGAAGGGLLTYAIVAATTRVERSVFSYGTLSVDFPS